MRSLATPFCSVTTGNPGRQRTQSRLGVLRLHRQDRRHRRRATPISEGADHIDLQRQPFLLFGRLEQQTLDAHNAQVLAAGDEHDLLARRQQQRAQ